MSAPYHRIAERWAINGKPLKSDRLIHTKGNPYKIYSYGYHYLIGRIDRAAKVAYINSTHSTPMTEVHKQECRNAASRERLTIVYVPDPDATDYKNLETLYGQLVEVSGQAKANLPDRWRLLHALDLYRNLRMHINDRIRSHEGKYQQIVKEIEDRNAHLQEVYMPNLIRDLARWKAGKREKPRDGFVDLPVEMRIRSLDPLVLEASHPSNGRWGRWGNDYAYTIEHIISGQHPFTQEQLDEVKIS